MAFQDSGQRWHFRHGYRLVAWHEEVSHPPDEEGLEAGVEHDHVQLPLPVHLHPVNLKHTKCKICKIPFQNLDCFNLQVS